VAVGACLPLAHLSCLSLCIGRCVHTESGLLLAEHGLLHLTA